MEKFGIVFSDRLRTVLLTILSIWVLAELGQMTYQLLQAYVQNTGFDVTVGQMAAITLLLFTPYYLAVGYTMRSLTTRIALYLEMKKQIVIAEYSPPDVLAPAEAGLLIDDDFTLNETAAVIKDLELRGHLLLDTSGSTIKLTYVRSASPMRDHEIFFIQTLFHNDDTFIISRKNADTFLQAGTFLGREVRSNLTDEGILSAQISQRKIFRFIFKIFVCLAAFLQAVWTITLLNNPKTILEVSYPRYPMSIVEPIIMVFVALLTIGIMLSGFWNKRLTDKHGLKNWRYVAGLKSYLETVYKGRFYDGSTLTVSKTELHNFYPYAIAFGIETTLADQMSRALISSE